MNNLVFVVQKWFAVGQNISCLMLEYLWLQKLEIHSGKLLNISQLKWLMAFYKTLDQDAMLTVM